MKSIYCALLDVLDALVTVGHADGGVSEHHIYVVIYFGWKKSSSIFALFHWLLHRDPEKSLSLQCQYCALCSMDGVFNPMALHMLFHIYFFFTKAFKRSTFSFNHFPHSVNIIRSDTFNRKMHLIQSYCVFLLFHFYKQSGILNHR